MNIAFVVNDAYVLGACALLNSIDDNMPGNHRVFICHGKNLSETNKKKLICSAKHMQVSDIMLDTERIERIPTPSNSHFGTDVWLKLAVPFALPADIDRALLIDCDTIVLGDISDMYDAELKDYYAAVCHDKYNANFFNSGVMVLNLPIIRKYLSFDEIIEYTAARAEDFAYVDQCVFEQKFRSNVIFFDWMTYNFLILGYSKKLNPYSPSYTNRLTEIEMEFFKNRTKIVHYVGTIKPFFNNPDDAIIPYREYYDKYAVKC